MRGLARIVNCRGAADDPGAPGPARRDPNANLNPDTDTHPTDATQKTIGVTVRLPVEFGRRAEELCLRHRHIGNDVIKRALIDYLRVHGRTDMVRDAFEKVLTRHAVAFDSLADL